MPANRRRNLAEFHTTNWRQNQAIYCITFQSIENWHPWANSSATPLLFAALIGLILTDLRAVTDLHTQILVVHTRGASIISSLRNNSDHQSTWKLDWRRHNTSRPIFTENWRRTLPKFFHSLKSTVTCGRNLIGSRLIVSAQFSTKSAFAAPFRSHYKTTWKIAPLQFKSPVSTPPFTFKKRSICHV